MMRGREVDDADEGVRFTGFVDALYGRVDEARRKHSGPYAIGAWIGERHAQELSVHPRASGRSFLALQAEKQQTERRHAEMLTRRLQSLKAAAAERQAVMDRAKASDKRADVSAQEHSELRLKAAAARAELAEIKGDIATLESARKSPCTDCPAYALCDVLGVACIAYRQFTAYGRYSYRTVPNIQTAAEIFARDG